MEKMRNKKIFFVIGSGDRSVGIGSTFSRVTFECENYKFDEEMIKETKEWLRDWDDNCTKVYTAEEWSKENEENN